MTQNNNFSVLPWYLSLDEQNHRKSYAFGNVYPLFTPKDRMLPFQITRDSSAGTLATVTAEMYRKNGTLFANIGTQLKESGLSLVKFPAMGYDIFVYPGNFQMPLSTPPGMYYVVLTDGVDVWYSDIFTVVMDVSAYLKIEWYDAENMVFDAGQIVYKNPAFRNVLYLSTELGKPEYVFNEEGEDRDGYFFPEKQISEKTYKFNTLAPEYLCDVMRLIRMSDYVLITDKYGRKYNCDTFLITPKWETQGDIASVDCEFQTATVVKKIGTGVIIGDNGDFNNDFNDDFNNLENG